MTTMRPRNRAHCPCSRRGMTLAEITVMLVIFSIFSTAAVTTLSLCLRYWNNTQQRLLAEQNVRVALQTMVADLRQGCPCAVPTVGYLTIGSTVSPTAVLAPNEDSTTDTALTFTEPNTANYDPQVSGFLTNASFYQRVRYYVASNVLHREKITYTTTGSSLSTSDIVVVSASSTGTLSLSTQYLSSNRFKVIVFAREGTVSSTQTANVTVVGR